MSDRNPDDDRMRLEDGGPPQRNAPANEVVITQDVSSGRIHKRYRMPGGQLASFEGCNLDDAGDYVIVDSIEGVRITGDLCRNCYPPVETVP